MAKVTLKANFRRIDPSQRASSSRQWLRIPAASPRPVAQAHDRLTALGASRSARAPTSTWSMSRRSWRASASRVEPCSDRGRRPSADIDT